MPEEWKRGLDRGVVPGTRPRPLNAVPFLRSGGMGVMRVVSGIETSEEELRVEVSTRRQVPSDPSREDVGCEDGS